MFAGVFAITNTITGEQYIGRSFDVMQRMRDYLEYLRCGRHQNRRLQAAWNEYGEGAFTFVVLWKMPKNAPAHTMDFVKGDLMAKLKPAYNQVGSKYVTPNLGRVVL